MRRRVPQGRHPTCQEAAALAPPSSVNVPAASTLLDHPGTVYLREVDLLPHLDGWLTGLFHPATLDVTLDALIAASQDASGTAEACARSSGRWPTASASSPATQRRWTPEQFNFLGVWTSRSSPHRPLVRTAPTRREPLGAHITTDLIGLRQADISQVPPERAR